jgi:hypothetical protein
MGKTAIEYRDVIVMHKRLLKKKPEQSSDDGLKSRDKLKRE